MWRFYWVSGCLALWTCFLWGKPAELPFLNELNPPVQQGAGAVLAPSVPELEWSLMSLSVPETRVEIRRVLPSGGTETAGRLLREGYSARRLEAALPITKTAALRLEAAFRSAGAFERVDSSGASVHAFPDSDWLLGVSFQKRFKKTIFLAGGKWTRAKRDKTRVDHAAAWDIQLAYEPNARWRFGVRARNLSGADLSGLGAPSRVRNETAAGVQHRIPLSSAFTLLLAADARVPSPHAAQGSGGASLEYRDAFGVAAGYMRRAERWRARYEPLDGGASVDEERLWIQRGPTAGVWLRIGVWRVSGAVSPLYAPNLPSARTEYQRTIQIARRM